VIASILSENKDEIIRTASQYGAHNLRVFGSLAKGEGRESSDVDILVDFEPGRSLMDHAALVLALENCSASRSMLEP